MPKSYKQMSNEYKAKRQAHAPETVKGKKRVKKLVVIEYRYTVEPFLTWGWSNWGKYKTMKIALKALETLQKKSERIEYRIKQ